MPFGRYGPAHFPPSGVRVYELPYEYLACFERKGYPRGRLGRQLKFVHDVKRDGAEGLFEPLRQCHGDGAPRRRRRPRSFTFPDPDPAQPEGFTAKSPRRKVH